MRQRQVAAALALCLLVAGPAAWLSLGGPLEASRDEVPAGSARGTDGVVYYPVPQLALGDHWDWRDPSDEGLFGYEVVANNAYLKGKDVYTLVARSGGVTQAAHRGNTFYMTLSDLNFINADRGERLLLDFPLWVGKNWTLSGVSPVEAVATVEAMEALEVEAGLFETLRIRVEATDPEVAGGHLLWWSHRAKFLVKSLSLADGSGFELASMQGLPPAAGSAGETLTSELPAAVKPHVEVVRRHGSFDAYSYHLARMRELADRAEAADATSSRWTSEEPVAESVDAVVVEFVATNDRPSTQADMPYVLRAWPHQESTWEETLRGRTLRFVVDGERMEDLRGGHLHLDLEPQSLALREQFAVYLSLFHYSEVPEGYSAL